MSRRSAIAALALVALLGLSGCTGFPYSPVNTATGVPSDAVGDGAQTTEDACALVQDTISEATTAFQNASTEDPTDVMNAMRSAAEQLSEKASQITNDDVAALLPSVQSVFDEVADVMAEIVAGDQTKVAELTGLGARLQDTSQRFQELCAP